MNDLPAHTPARDAATVTAHLPVIDGDTCVHGRCATATCRACVDACPRQALRLTDESLGLIEDACDGCSLCRPACPEAAISFPGLRFDPILEDRSGVAMIACERAAVEAGRAVIPCLHALGRRDLELLSAKAVTAVHVARADCAACPRQTSASIDLAARKQSLFNISRGRARIAVQDLTGADWQARREQLLRRGNDIDPARRALFGGLVRDAPAAGQTARPPPDGNVYRYVPRINENTCDGCDACARMCPHGAITLTRIGGTLQYAIEPEGCTGCGLCSDVCGAAAVAVTELSRLEVPRVTLHESRCAKCGAPFHRPDPTGTAPTVCRICAQSNHPGLLFQVRR